MSIKNLLPGKYQVTGLSGLIIGIASLVLPGAVFGQFSGAESCIDCHYEHHEENLNNWRASGHPYMLMSSEEARNRAIPLPGGFTWDDISYVVGGHKWKALYLDNNGYFITTTKNEAGSERPGLNQYNMKTGEWSDYRPGDVNVPYDCGNCHTTNWVANPSPENTAGNQGGLAGLHGKFDATGVECEQCHGNGLTMDDDTPKQAEFCGTCHGSEDLGTIAAANGFITSHQQYNELLAGPHSSTDCATCHNAHKRADLSIETTCANCHPVQAAAYADNVMSDYGVTCVDCHMPTVGVVAQPLGPNQGDLKTHLFYINTDPEANMFTQEGDFVALDFVVSGKTDKAAVTLNFACKRCHQTTEVAELARFAKNFHGTEQGVEPLDYAGITPGLSGHWWGGSTRSGEGFLIDVSYRSDGKILVVASFYTYDSAGNQLWLIGQKAVDPGENTVTMNLKVPQGAQWGPDFDPADLPSPRTPWGTAEFMFDTCGTGTFVATPNAEMMAQGFVQYGYDLARDISISGHSCPSMMNNPGILSP
ncbi:MAG: cytochrome c3 family protein [Xanthomonadales bacterium]|nr:cytochrome c3 family protein [Xanthomonadales bacterium]